ncbi:DNA-directed RNA polymerases I and III subunit RPAC1 [Phymastichus coffea]|uniref:DNA-directed RNA polymerases I and III subunit RPAC1 n=1 Tax=Phymastichus coffea TaxID=108790 RepID=UPI00273A9304|nr:DNA-directed RNA polymerases I and III subunit RPAC1 [Phymastichus coffea]XP_058805681.1 DNA-directed RNA polymerases I and III subunit RPAC1 [Phymastichus coffea]XP_058805682.1 DNA-directed RNA polymerases I and III subunit RPAC1 [Phymastichus coffea]
MEKTNKKKTRVIMEEYGIPNAFEFANLLHLQEDWTIDKFKENFKIKIVKQSEDMYELEFDLIECSAALANAFRRILLSEVPSMAIEKVYMLNNTSIIQDEVLAHRLGLLPLKADPRLFEYPSLPSKTSSGEDEVSDQDTLRYEIKVTCKWNPQAPKDSRRPDDIYCGNNVYSRDIKWVPIGRQAELYPNGEKQLGMIYDNILLCKMRPNQEIHAFMHAVKGIGKDHAKFSPVATASYRLLPDIQIMEPITGKAAEKFRDCFSPGVIELVKNGKGEVEAKVKNARYDSCSRNVFHHDELKKCVKLGRIPDHFIFNVESVGTLPSSVLFLESIKVLKDKCKTFIEELNSIL